MLDLGIWEIVTIFIVAVLVLKPEDVPELMRTAGKWFGKLRNMSNEISRTLHQATDVRYDVRKVVDMDGNIREAYDVKQIEELNRTVTPQPATQKVMGDEE